MIKNEKDYVNFQMACTKFNAFLILENPDAIIKQLLHEKSVDELRTFLNSYLTCEYNLLFITYFDDERKKLIAIFELLIAITQITYCTKELSYVDDDLNEKMQQQSANSVLDLKKSIIFLKERKKIFKGSLEKQMFSIRNMKKTKDAKNTLKKYYLFDVKVGSIVNSNYYTDLNITEDNYEFVLSSLLYYFRTIVFTNNKRYTETNVVAILNSKFESDLKEIVRKVSMESYDIDFKDFLSLFIKEQEDLNDERSNNGDKSKCYLKIKKGE
ncbi:MAG: hypothetical protein RR325_02920 [Bacilli bacterium]